MKPSRNMSLEIHKALTLAESFDFSWAIKQRIIEFHSVKTEEYQQLEKMQEQGKLSLIEVIKGKRHKFDKVVIELQ